MDYERYFPTRLWVNDSSTRDFDRFAISDGYKSDALQDRDTSERAARFFWAVYGYIMYSTFDKAHQDGASVLPSGITQQFQFELSHYFWEKPWLKSPEPFYLASCAVLCGTKAIDMRVLTRAKAYQECLDRHNARK